jgi:glutaredoxin
LGHIQVAYLSNGIINKLVIRDDELTLKMRRENVKIKGNRIENRLGERRTKVSMYTLSTCPECRKTKEFFRARGIQFDLVDYDLTSENKQNKIAAEMMKGTGHSGFPFVRIVDVVVIELNPEMFEQLLKSEKLEPASSQA